MSKLAPTKSKSVKIVRYFDIVRDDLARIPDAISYYKEVVKDGERYIPVVGTLEDLQLGQIGLHYTYEGVYNDCHSIRTWFEEEASVEASRKYRWYQSPEARREFGDLKVTDIKNYVDTDESVIALKQIVLMIKDVERSLNTMVDMIKLRTYRIDHIQALREKGIHEIWIDSQKENTNG